MNEKDYLKCKKSFDQYFKSFLNQSLEMDLKYQHSYHVADYMFDLAKRLHLKESDCYLAKTIGLLHDIGRFEQLKKINSFNDQEFDHADYARVYLFDLGHIRDFISNDKYDLIIEKAIVNHNKLKIEDGFNKREILFSKMIRDMDKVDIYYQVALKYKIQFTEKPTKKILNDFYDEKCIYSPDKKNKSDGVIQFLAFIHDFNFKESFDILKESDNFNFYICSVEVSDDNKELFHELVLKCFQKMGDMNGKE